MSQLERRIDVAQNKIDLIDTLEDSRVSRDGTEYAEIFLKKVDDFQERLETVRAPFKVKEGYRGKVALFLESVDPERIGIFAGELNKKLSAFISGLDVFSKGGNGYTITEGDWLSSIAQRCFNKEGKQLSWMDLYSYNKARLKGNPKAPVAEQHNWIYPGEKLAVPDEYRYFSEKELPDLELLPPPGEHKAAKKFEGPKKPEEVPRAHTDASADNVELESQIVTMRGIIEDKIADLRREGFDEVATVVTQAYESLVKTESDTVEKIASEELLANLVSFDERLNEIIIESASYNSELGGEDDGHGEIEKTVVRLIRKVPFLANFTPVGLWLGLLNSTLGLENADMRDRAIEGAKFVASIIPVAGNLVDITEGIYGLMTGKRIGTDIQQTMGEALFSIGIGIGGLAIDVLTLGVAGAPIKAAFKAGWKIGLRKLPGIIVQAAKEYIATHAVQALKKPFGAVKDFGKWAAETFVVAPIKFVTTPVKFLWKNKKKIAHEAIETVKHPVQQAKKAAAAVSAGLGSMWGSAKAWWKRRKEDKGKSIEERATEAKTQNQTELSEMEVQRTQVDDAVSAKEMEVASAADKDAARGARRELDALRAEREALENRIAGRRMAVREMDDVLKKAEAARAQAREAKMKQWDAAELQRGKVLESLRSADVAAMDAKSLKKGLATANQEIAVLEEVLKHADDMPDDKFSWHERQLEELCVERDRYHKEFEAKKEAAKNSFTDALAGITATLREIEGKIKMPRLKAPEFSGLSQRIAAAAEHLSQLRERLGELIDFGLRERFDGVMKSMAARLDDAKKHLQSRIDKLEEARQRKKTERAEKNRGYEAVDEIASNSLDRPKVVEGKNGIIVYGTDEGVNYKPINEDRVVVNTEYNAFASIDGMGGMGHGDKAAQILAEEMQRGFREGADLGLIHSRAHLRMRSEKVGEGGACYVAGKITGDNLEITRAGDVRLIIIGKDGQPRFATADQGVDHMVYNAIQGNKHGEVTRDTIQLEPGDRIIAASDGLTDNLGNYEIAALVRGKSAAEAIAALNGAAKRKMRDGTGKPDNINTIIYDYDHKATVPEKAAPYRFTPVTLHERVYVKRFEGHYEDGWEVKSLALENGEFLVINKELGLSKSVTRDEFRTAAEIEGKSGLSPEQQSSLADAPGNAPVKKRAEVEPALRMRKRFEQLAQDEKQPHLTRSLLADERFQPKGEVTIEGRTFYVSSIVQGPTGRMQVFLYTEVNGVMVPRLYYKSKSDGGWRATPGMVFDVTGDGRFSKGKFEETNYTTETKPHIALIEYIEQESRQPLQIEVDPSRDYFSMFGQGEQVMTYMEEMVKFDDRGLLKGPQQYPSGKLREVDVDDWIRQSNRLPLGFVPNFSAGPIEVHQITHTLLTPATGKKITIETYPAQLEGRLVHWNVAYDSTGRVWIENIYFPDAPLNSYGLRSEIIDMGSLTNKPLEYQQQSSGLEPPFVEPFNDQYNDITPLLDQLRPIQEFRAARGISRQPLRQAA